MGGALPVVQEVSITSVRVTILAAIGALTQSRVDYMKAAFGLEFPNVMMPSGGGAAIFANPETGFSVLLANGDFAVEMVGSGIEADLPRMRDYVSQVVDAFMLDKRCRAAVRCTSLISSKGNDAMSESMEFARSLVGPAGSNGLIGAGTRLFYGGSGAYSELRVEPYLADNRYFYSESTYSIGDETDLAEIFAMASTYISEYRSRVLDTLTQITGNS